MDRLNRMLQAAQGMGMGGAAPGGVSWTIAFPVSPCVYLSKLLAGRYQWHILSSTSNAFRVFDTDKHVFRIPQT